MTPIATRRTAQAISRGRERAMRWGEDRQVMVTLSEQVMAAVDVMVARGEVGSRVEAVLLLVARGLGR